MRWTISAHKTGMIYARRFTRTVSQSPKGRSLWTYFSESSAPTPVRFVATGMITHPLWGVVLPNLGSYDVLPCDSSSVHTYFCVGSSSRIRQYASGQNPAKIHIVQND